MKQYCYRVFMNGSMIQPRFAGTITAQSMEDAVQRIASRDALQYVPATVEYSDSGWAHTRPAHWTIDGKKASIAIWARPEDFNPNQEPQS